MNSECRWGSPCTNRDGTKYCLVHESTTVKDIRKARVASMIADYFAPDCPVTENDLLLAERIISTVQRNDF